MDYCNIERDIFLVYISRLRAMNKIQTTKFFFFFSYALALNYHGGEQT